MKDNIEVDGFVKQRQELESLLMTNPQMEMKVQGLIRKVLLAARRTIANDAKGGNTYEPQRKLRPRQRGGNRLPRSQRTQQIMSYDGSDRAFILRFLNQGTTGRTTRFGYRGRIAPRNFFSTSSHTAMQQAPSELTKLIDDLIKQEIK